MRRPTSMRGIFKDYANNRRQAQQARQASTSKYLVLGVTAKGTPRRIEAADWTFNAKPTLEAAESRKRDLEALNPGKVFVVVEV
jgi:hypothetical protein